MASLPKTCAVCSAPLSPRNASGYCTRCQNRQPGKRAKIAAAVRRSYQLNPELRVIRRASAVKNARDPEINARRSAAARRDRLWEKGVAARTPETYAKIAATQRAASLAWCPPHLREDYRRMMRCQRFKAAEARSLILEQHEAEMRRWRRGVGAEPEPPMPKLGGRFIDRASEVAARWAEVATLWNSSKGHTLARARWAVFLALRRGGWTPNRIGAETGMDRKSVEYGLKRAEVLAAAPGDFADLYRRVVAA